MKSKVFMDIEANGLAEQVLEWRRANPNFIDIKEHPIELQMSRLEFGKKLVPRTYLMRVEYRRQS